MFWGTYGSCRCSSRSAVLGSPVLEDQSVTSQISAIGPWHHRSWLHIGGLIAIGFPSDLHLFTLSWNGRGLFNLHTLERTARDDEDPAGTDWIAQDQLSASGIGEFAGQMIAITGLWGGMGVSQTPDGWRLQNRVNSGTVVSSLLVDPTGSQGTRVPLASITEYRAVSFNPSGDFLLLASSSEVHVLRRM
jgi:hypothetical protein